ncbi:MAG: dihydroxyacetone kinase subunit DhaL [Firmicutes bacterium]|nr:dihydroxyacetone kinase subunit DhaL [Bacillota bacterium]
MKFEDLKKAILAAADDIIAREIELCELDSFVGDGDHGVTVRKGYQKIKAAIAEDDPKTMGELLFSAGMGLADTAGGAIGPILASMFIGFSTSVGDKSELTVKDLAKMFDSGLKAVQELGGAQPGDCTMVDALYPFVQSLNQADTEDEKAALDAAVQKAYEGSESTKNMVAKKGRAKNLADKSLGYVDAGSRSMYYFLRAFARSLE